MADVIPVSQDRIGRILLVLSSLAALGFAYGTPESLAAAPFDGGLTVLLAAAYLCTRGWRSWLKKEVS